MTTDNPAAALGRLAKGKAKTITPADRKRRSQWCREMTKKRVEARNALQPAGEGPLPKPGAPPVA